MDRWELDLLGFVRLEFEVGKKRALGSSCCIAKIVDVDLVELQRLKRLNSTGGSNANAFVDLKSSSMSITR